MGHLDLDLLIELLGFKELLSLLMLTSLLQIPSFLLMCIQFKSQLSLLLLELILSPSPEPECETTPLPVEDGLPHESPFLVLLVDNVKPLVEAS